MTTRIPPVTRDEIAYRKALVRQNRLSGPSVRFSRALRRGAVVGLYVSLGLLLTVNVFVSLPGPLLVVPFVFFFIVVFSVGGLGMWTGRDRLDERESYLDDHATANAYKVVAVAVILLAAYLGLVYFFKAGLPLPSTSRDLLNLVIPLFYLVITLPRAILAWTLPDPVRDPKTQ
jgi:hypothetical protein